MKKPQKKPKRPFFSSGPCPKPDVWNLSWLKNAFLSRSHRSSSGKIRFFEIQKLTRNLLKLPDEYALIFTPAGGTGAFEMALWSLLGPYYVDILEFEYFGSLWAHDIQEELKIKKSHRYQAPYGELPKIDHLNPEHDLVFPWTGTASTAKVPLSKIEKRKKNALTFIDGTAALFCEPLDWEKCDVFSFSWQKALGSEGAHGALILSPRALKRLYSYTPSWSIPRIFRLKNKEEIFSSKLQGEPINTPSLLCVEDYHQILKWAISIGGYEALQKKSCENSKILEIFLKNSFWARPLVKNPENQSRSCMAIEIIDEKFWRLKKEQKHQFLLKFYQILEKENVAFDISSYNKAPLGLRIWTGPTIDKNDLRILCEWLDYAFYICKNYF